MYFDYASLLLATGVTALAGGMTFLLSWISDKSGGFLISCGCAMLGVGVAIASFLYFAATSNMLIGYVSCAILLVAMAVATGSANQFRTGKFPLYPTLVTSISVIVILSAPFSIGLSGLGFIVANLCAGLLLIVAGSIYWQCRAENRSMLIPISALYVIAGMSFFPCAIAIALDTPLVLNSAPENLAESANLLICAVSVTGIVALSIALSNQRQVRLHRQDSHTDPLTGLYNRRALFDKFGTTGLPVSASILVYDFDHFKPINDQYGHAIGDKFLKAFAEICHTRLRQDDVGIRLGGEEFAIILPQTDATLATAVAESIRLTFSKLKIDGNGDTISCTVSCGIYANQSPEPHNLDKALSAADGALYRAKHLGRNQVCLAGHVASQNNDGAALRSRAIANIRKAT